MSWLETWQWLALTAIAGVPVGAAWRAWRATRDWPAAGPFGSRRLFVQRRRLLSARPGGPR